MSLTLGFVELLDMGLHSFNHIYNFFGTSFSFFFLSYTLLHEYSHYRYGRLLEVVLQASDAIYIGAFLLFVHFVSSSC